MHPACNDDWFEMMKLDCLIPLHGFSYWAAYLPVKQGFAISWQVVGNENPRPIGFQAVLGQLSVYDCRIFGSSLPDIGYPQTLTKTHNPHFWCFLDFHRHTPLSHGVIRKSSANKLKSRMKFYLPRNQKPPLKFLPISKFVAVASSAIPPCPASPPPCVAPRSRCRPSCRRDVLPHRRAGAAVCAFG